ncbi:MAG TPA: Nif3-like dinuclear metal center hexameric protein [Bacteroidota bacterium]|nr:Nif3-like dinuclear metal center hexameric protein [Bacteroidota bacterium]
MVLGDIQHIMESWAPREIAWERDNVGIQIGSPQQEIEKIIVCLDVTEEVVREAISRNADLIISHHPLLFHPLRRISPEERTGKLVSLLVQHRIAVYSAHTNLDFASDGVSVALAQQLRLTGITVLKKSERLDKKVIVFVPPDYRDRVLSAMAKAGAGAIGKYESCSFGSEGVGTFTPITGARPFIGTVGTLEQVHEVRLEMVVPSWRLHDVLQAMRSAHPYEEVAYDVLDLANDRSDMGEGAVGLLSEPVGMRTFLTLVKKRLRVSFLRYGRARKRRIHRVAVCGGSGSDLLQNAIRQGADAFVTADVRYHRFEEAEGQILLVDAGHFETEVPVLQNLIERIRTECRARKFRVQINPSSRMSNFVSYC